MKGKRQESRQTDIVKRPLFEKRGPLKTKKRERERNAEREREVRPRPDLSLLWFLCRHCGRFIYFMDYIG